MCGQTIPLDDVVRVHFGPRHSPGFQARAMLLRLLDWQCFSLECANGDFVDIRCALLFSFSFLFFFLAFLSLSSHFPSGMFLTFLLT